MGHHTSTRRHVGIRILAVAGAIVLAVGISSSIAGAHHRDQHPVDPFGPDDTPANPAGVGASSQCPPGLVQNKIQGQAGQAGGKDGTQGTDCVAATVDVDDDEVIVDDDEVIVDDVVNDDDAVVDGDDDEVVTTGVPGDVATDEAVLGVVETPDTAETTARAVPEALAFTGSPVPPAGLLAIGLGTLMLGAGLLLDANHGRIRRRTTA